MACQPRLRFQPIHPSNPDQLRVVVVASGKEVGDVAPDEEERGRWLARPLRDDAFHPGFRSRRAAGDWLVARAGL